MWLYSLAESRCELPYTAVRDVLHRLAGRVQYYRIKYAVRTADGYHSVRRRAVIIYRVALVQYLGMVADLDLKAARKDDIALLPLMGGKLDVLGLCLLAVGRYDIKRLGNTVFKGSRHIIIGHAVRLVYLLTAAASCDGVACKPRAGALDNVGNINAERQSAAVKESKRKVAFSCLAVNVFGSSHTGLFSHFFDRQTDYLAQRLYSACHFGNFEFKS